MARNEQDPAASTQQFRAFANRGDSAGRGPNTALIITIVAGLLVAVAVIALLVVG
jgi:hypothetical protein